MIYKSIQTNNDGSDSGNQKLECNVAISTADYLPMIFANKLFGHFNKLPSDFKQIMLKAIHNVILLNHCI